MIQDNCLITLLLFLIALNPCHNQNCSVPTARNVEVTCDDQNDINDASKPSVKIGILVDYQEEITKGVTNATLFDMLDSVEERLTSRGFPVQTVIISDFEAFSAEVEDDPSLCDSLTVILSAVSCGITRQLYQLVHDHCPGTTVLAIHDRTCPRPSSHHGIGFPVRSSIRDVIPMVMDLRHDFLRSWDHINLIHDDSVDHEMVHKYVEGLTTSEVKGAPVPEVLVYKVDSHGYGSPVRHHENCTTDAGRSAITFTSAHLIDHIQDDDDNMKYFVVIASSGTIESIVEEVSFHRSVTRRSFLNYSSSDKI